MRNEPDLTSPLSRRAPMTSEEAAPAVSPPAVRWGVFVLICLAYLVATTGEQLLSPVFPTVKDDL
jgi:hypothetical protein